MSYKMKQVGKRPLFPLFLLLAIGVILVAGRGVEAEPSGGAAVGFSSYFGGSGEECLFERCAITTDADGNIYIAGTTRSQDFPTKNPIATDDDNDGSGNDVFVTKFEPNGTDVVFSTYIGNGSALGIALDNDGNIYVTGFTGDDDYPTSFDALQTCTGNGIDAFVTQLSNDGQTQMYSSCFGGSGRDEAYEVVVDSNDNVIIVGNTLSDDYPVSSAAQGNRVDDEDIFITKFSTNTLVTSVTFSTYWGGDSRDYAWSVDLDSSDNIYIAGRTGSDDFPTTAGVFQPERFSNAGSDAIVAKFNPAGIVQYSTFYNGTSTNEAADLAVDSAGNVYLVTIFEEVVKINADATAVSYVVELEGAAVAVEGEAGIALDSENNAYVVTRTAETNRELLLTAVHHTGRVVYTNTLGGSDADEGMRLALYEHNDQVDAVMVGTTGSTNFPTVNPVQNSLSGSTDLVIVNLTGLEAEVVVNDVYLPLIVR